jgi:hypothetical protein
VVTTVVATAYSVIKVARPAFIDAFSSASSTETSGQRGNNRNKENGWDNFDIDYSHSEF